MTIYKKSSEKYTLVLNSNEVIRCFGSYGNILHPDRKTKEKVKKMCGNLLDGNRNIYTRILPFRQNGCKITCGIIKNRRCRERNDTAFLIKNEKDLYSALEAVSLKCTASDEVSVYFEKGFYKLIIKSANSGLYGFLNEFSAETVTEITECERIKEYGYPLISNNLFKKLKRIIKATL